MPDYHAVASIRDELKAGLAQTYVCIQKRSFLLILDASKMQEVARTRTEGPESMHAQWRSCVPVVRKCLPVA
jgi:hypothetical protein